jgi:hypothetical protein
MNDFVKLGFVLFLLIPGAANALTPPPCELPTRPTGASTIPFPTTDGRQMYMTARQQRILMTNLERASSNWTEFCAGMEAKTDNSPVAVRRRLPTAPLDAELEKIVRADSESWLLFQYDFGTVRNSTLEGELDSGTYAIYGEYTYNLGKPGWVRVQFRDAELSCIEFWNESQCRPFRSPPSHDLVRDMLTAATVPRPQSDVAGDAPERICRWVSKAIPRSDGGPDRVINVQECG